MIIQRDICLAILTIVSGLWINTAHARDVETVSYDRQIRTIFQAKCQGCHQPAKPGGGYVMTDFEQLLKGSESGAPAIVPSHADQSYLVEQITVHGGIAEMPKDAPPLSAAEIELITKWINQGAANDSPNSRGPRFSQDNPPQYSRPPVISSLDVSPNGDFLAISGFHEVLIHRTDGTGMVARLIGLSERIESVRFSPDGSRLAVAGGVPARMGEIQIWDVRELADADPSVKLQLSHAVTYDTIYGVSWSPDGKLIGFGCGDTTLRALDVKTGTQVLFQGAHDDWVLDTVFSKSGDFLASVGRDMTAKLTEVESQRFIDNITSITPKALKGGIQAVVRHPLRDEIIFGGADGIPKIYQMHRTTKRQIGDDANQRWELPPLPGRIFGIDISNDGRRIVAGSSLDGKGYVHLYEMATAPVVPDNIETILKKPTHTRSDTEWAKLQNHFSEGVKTVAKHTFEADGIYAVTLSADGRRVFAGGSAGTLYEIDGETGNLIKKFKPIEVKKIAKGQVAQNTTSLHEESSAAPRNKVAPESIKSLSVFPTEVRLANENDYSQIVVTAELHSGQLIDVTRSVKFDGDNHLATVSEYGTVSPNKNGAGVLNISLNEHNIDLPIHVSGIGKFVSPDFIRDVNPVLSKVGCNAGTCHGSQDGQNGFKLSLRGYDALYDVRALADDLGSRRVSRTAPGESLILQKTTASVPHEGGQVIAPNSKYYRILHDWVAAGAQLNRDSVRVVGLEVFPNNPVIEKIGDRQQVRVLAKYEDGSTRDVTNEAFVESGNTDVVVRDSRHEGLMQALRRGEAAVLVRYEGAYAATTLTVMGDRQGFVWVEPEKNNRIDDLVANKLKRNKILASPLCDDHTFVRRVYLDLTGLPPTPDAIQQFIGKNSDEDGVDRRNELIDRLIGSTEFVEHWTNKWADLLQVNGKFLGREGATALRDWIRGHIDKNTPYDQFARLVLTASGSTADNPAAAYYKILRTPEDTLENTTHLFLATRFNCNKCHDHPFERWTQDQYYELGSFFAQIGRKADPRVGDKEIGRTQVESGKPLHEVIYDLDKGDLKHDRTGELTSPKFPFECDFQEPKTTTRRSQLAAWITSPNNPYFARSYVNRLWGYLTGRGIIEPIDDIRAGNPPTNPELLDYLTDEFINHGFDARHIIRLICQSRTYQLSVETNRWNEDDSINYSHAIPRRLSAESLYDAIHSTTGAKSKFPGLPEGTRAAALPDAGVKLPDGFLGNFGRPARESACECERSSGMQLGPVIALISGPTVGDAISDPENAIAKLAKESANDNELVNNLYLRIVNRPATEHEISIAESVFAEIGGEHHTIVDELKRYETEIAEQQERRQQERADQLDSAKQTLAEYEKQLAPQRETLEKARKTAIEEVENQIAKRRQQIESGIPEWERENKLGSRWMPLDPIAMVASNNSPLERESDLRIYAPPRGRDVVYEIVARSPIASITGFRLDAISDKRLRQGGPGNSYDGNFILTEFAAAHAPHVQQDELRFRHWDFSSGNEGWSTLVDCTMEQKDGILTLTNTSGTPSIVTDLSAPVGKMTLEIVADLEKFSTFELLWKTERDNEFSHDRKATLRVVDGANPFRRYRIHFETDSPLTGLRLDPDNRKSKIRIDSMTLLATKPPVYNQLTFTAAQADFSEEGYDVSTSIDGKTPNEGNGWGVAPQTNQDHVAVFAIDQPVGDGTGLIKITMKHFHKTKEHQIGLFRLSVTDDRQPISIGLPHNIGQIVDIEESNRTDEQSTALLNFIARQDDQIRELNETLKEKQKPVPPDTKLAELKKDVERLSKPLPVDPRLDRLRRAAKLSETQLANQRLTAAQDLTWALINSPAFLYNH